MGIRFNANEISQMGVEIEQNGQAFYAAAAAATTDGQARALFEELADWEAGHIKLFEGLQAKLSNAASEAPVFDPDNEMVLYIKAAADTHVFGADSDPAGLANACATPVEALRKAIEFEKDSIVVYTTLRNMVPPKLGKDDIDQLINEELKHVQMLTQKIADLG